LPLSLTPSPSPTGAAHANAGAARRAKAVAMPLAELGAQLAELISANELELEGAMPTATQLDAAGRRDLNTAIAKHGGVGAVCRSLGLRDKKPYWPRDRTCNFALLVAAHASWRRAGGRDGLAGRELDAALRESALTKEELMAAANPIAEVDIHEVHNDYNGWAGVIDDVPGALEGGVTRHTDRIVQQRGLPAPQIRPALTMVAVHVRSGGPGGPGSTSGSPGGFWSPHVGGCQFLLMDGSVTMISQNIDIQTYRDLAARNDGNVLSEF